MMTEEEIYVDAVKKKRVFEHGYCWRCAENPGGRTTSASADRAGKS
jgi:hypothetical protein